MNYNKYPKYKDSGIDWLGRIPEHWEVRKLKNDSAIKNGATPSTNIDDFWDGDILWITPAEINDITFIDNSKRKITQQGYNSCGTNLVPENSIILTTRAPIGKLVIAKKSLCTNQGCKSIIPINFNTKFQFYQLTIRKKELNALGTGTTFMELGNFELKNLQCVAPPLPEQTTIANFLDYKLEKIDRFITKKTQLIKLLNEQKAAIINQAVTKGVPTNDELLMMNDELKKNNIHNSQFTTHNYKDSGIEWLGDIPDSWEVRKLKYSVQLNKHTSFDNDENSKNKIALENIEGKTGRILDLNENPFEGDGTVFKKGDILFGKLRPYLAKVVTPNFEGSCVNELLVLSPNKKDWLPEFLKYRMLAGDFIGIVDNSTYGAKMPRASWSFIGSLKISKPIKAEQQEIVNHIETETAKTEKTITTIQKEISLIEEYKTALIAEAVTGKIDVRGFEL